MNYVNVTKVFMKKNFFNDKILKMIIFDSDNCIVLVKFDKLLIDIILKFSPMSLFRVNIQHNEVFPLQKFILIT